MFVAVTGKTGQVVSAIVEAGARVGVKVYTIGRPQIDLLSPKGFLKEFEKVSPDIIISAAAYTNVDDAEFNPDKAQKINSNGAGAIAFVARELNIPVVHLSTDYVFDGAQNTPYLETDKVAPLGVYGRTKLIGEQAILSAVPNNAVVLRTSWVYSVFGKNFVKSILHASLTKDILPVVHDQIGCPTSAHDIAAAVLKIASNLVYSPTNLDLRGVFHLAGSGEASWAEFAEHILTTSKRLGGPYSDVARIPTSQYPTKAKRPVNSRLNTDKLYNIYQIRLPNWKVSANEVILRLLSETPYFHVDNDNSKE